MIYQFHQWKIGFNLQKKITQLFRNVYLLQSALSYSKEHGLWS